MLKRNEFDGWTLRSTQDDSVNVILKSIDRGLYETRFVRRHPGKAIIYVSTQDGCSQGCRMCHLTATHQKRRSDANLDMVCKQIDRHTVSIQECIEEIDRVHINFMARGEPLSNYGIASIVEGVENYIFSDGPLADIDVDKRIIISTIFPKKVILSDVERIYGVPSSNIYYSLYSACDKFRKKWLPNSLPAAEALQIMRHFCSIYGKRPVLHFCFIEGENDSVRDVEAVANLINDYVPQAKINIVRFNPAHNMSNRESSFDLILKNVALIKSICSGVSLKLIDRVGFDVKASCGMFVTGGEIV